AWQVGGTLRALGLHARRDLGNRLFRSVGRRIGQGTRAANYSRAGKPRRRQAGTRQFHQQPDSPLPEIQGDPMNKLGYDQPLYIVPFDHRGSFQNKLFGWTGTLTADQTAEIAASKQVIYDGFKAAVRDEVPDFRAGILVDEQFGAAILKDAWAH